MDTKKEKFQAKGKIFFLLDTDENGNDNLKYFILDKDYYLKECCHNDKDFLKSYYEMNFNFDIYHMKDGKTFLRQVIFND